jgi:hypothetical protein
MAQARGERLQAPKEKEMAETNDEKGRVGGVHTTRFASSLPTPRLLTYPFK